MILLRCRSSHLISVITILLWFRILAHPEVSVVLAQKWAWPRKFFGTHSMPTFFGTTLDPPLTPTPILQQSRIFFRRFKQNCLVHITLRADESGNSLMVRSVNFDYNHDVTQVCISMQHSYMYIDNFIHVYTSV